MNTNRQNFSSYPGNAPLKKSIRILLLLMFFMLTHFCVSAQQPRPKWVDDFKGNSGSASLATYVAVDNQNNIYVTGGFFGTVDFDPSAGVKNLTSVGDEDVFVAKYTQNGTLIWAESMGGAQGDVPTGLALDKDGNVSIVGYYFSSAFDADPGPGVYVLAGGVENAFVIHLNTNGGFLWANSFEGINNGNMSNMVITDSQDNVITTSLISTSTVVVGDSTYNTSQDGSGLVVKYGPTGDVLWSIALRLSTNGTANEATAYGVKVDSHDNILISGTFGNPVRTGSTINFNPLGAAYNLIATGNVASYVAKYNSSGILIWGNTINYPPSTLFQGYPQSSICLDQQDNVYFSDAFYPSIIFGDTTLTATGNGENECIAKYSATGVLQFAKSFGGTGTTGFVIEPQHGMGIDANKNIYLSGYFHGSVNFDPNKSAAGNISTAGGEDFYVAKYDSVANYIYAFGAGSPNCSSTQSRGLAIDANNNIDVAGGFCSTVNFDQTGCSTTNVTATSGADPFLAQYATEAPIANNVIASPAISSFCANGSPSAITGSLPTGGDGTYTYQWQSSADSVSFVNISGATSQNYTPPTITATTYYQRIVNSGGCPSPPPALLSNIVKLTILPALTAPVVTVAGTTSSTVIFTWTAVTGATGYQVSTDGGLTYSAHTGLTDTIGNLQPGQSVTLIVQATGSIACQTSAASAPVTGMVPAGDLVYVPNAFTPNGDGRNDVLHVLGANIQTLKFYIYDQWGEQIFSTTSPQNGWDGTYKGTKEPVGVYVYSLEAIMNDGTSVKKKGTVTLLK